MNGLSNKASSTSDELSEKEFTDFYHFSLDIFCILSYEDKLLQVNQAITPILGYSPDEFCRDTILTHVYADDKEATRSALRSLQSQSVLRNYVNRYQHRDGSIRFLEWNARSYGPKQFIYASARDITERRQNLLNLQLDEERCKLALDGNRNGVWDWNMQTGETFFSPRWKTMIGLPPANTVNHIDDWKQRIHPADRDRVFQTIKEHIALNSDFFEVEHRLKLENGRYRWMLTRGRLAPPTSSLYPYRVVGTQTDIHDQKKAQTRLKESEARLKAIINNGLTTISLLDRKGRVLFADQKSKEGIKRFYDINLKRGDYLANYVPASYRRFFKRHLAQALRGKTVRAERFIEFSDKAQYWIDTIYQPILNENQQVDEVIVSHIDITERKRTENQVRLLALVAQNTSNAIYITNGRWEIEWINEGFTQLTGYSLEEVEGRIPFKFLHGPKTDAAVAKKIREAMQRKEAIHTEVQEYDKAGRSFWVTMNLQPVKNTQDVVTNFISVNTDISRHKRYERKIEKQNEALIKANQELDNFVYRVSHDLRAPISSSLGLIKISTDENELSQVKYYLSLQERSLSKLDNFIKDILHYSRNTRLEISPEQIEFENVLESIFDQFEYIQSFKSIDRVVEVDQPVPFYTDRRRLYVILSNLISNALKFANPRAEQSYVKATAQVGDQQAVITVEDNGVGIHSDYVNKVFDMFFRGGGEQAGSGLGLYIVKETVDKIKGKVTVESLYGQGTVFTITLPNLRPSA